MHIVLTLNGGTVDTVSGTAHLAGGLVGVTAGVLIIRNRKVEWWEDKFWYLALVILIATFLVFIILNIISLINSVHLKT